MANYLLIYLTFISQLKIGSFIYKCTQKILNTQKNKRGSVDLLAEIQIHKQKFHSVFHNIEQCKGYSLLSMQFSKKKKQHKSTRAKAAHEMLMNLISDNIFFASVVRHS